MVALKVLSRPLEKTSKREQSLPSELDLALQKEKGASPPAPVKGLIGKGEKKTLAFKSQSTKPSVFAPSTTNERNAKLYLWDFFYGKAT